MNPKDLRYLVYILMFLLVFWAFKVHADNKTIVKCNFRVNGFSFYIEGELIERSGDNWMIDFTDVLKNYPAEDVAPYVKTLNGNQCNLVKGKLPYTKEYYK